MVDYVIGVDPGGRRVGLAVADLETRIARPFEVVDVQLADPVVRIDELVTELGATTVVVGRPTTLAGTAGPAVEVQQKFVAALRASLTVPVVETDERLTTVMAERALRSGGADRDERKALRDAVAAQILLQDYLDSAS